MAAGNEIHLKDYIRVIQKRRFLLVTFFSVVFGLVVIGTFTATPRYQATTKLYIERIEPYSLIKEIRFATYDPEFYGTQYQLIKSKRVAMSVVRMLSPDRMFQAYFGRRVRGGSLLASPLGWAKGLFTAAVGGASQDESGETGGGDGEWANDIAEIIAAGIIVKPVKDSKMVDISYQSESAELASLVANTVAKAYIEATLEMKMSSSQYTMGWMTRKAEEEKAKLDGSERALQAYMQENDIVTLEDRLTIVPEKLSELSTNLTRAETKRKEAETLYEKVRSLPRSLKGAESLPAISSDPLVRSIREQILTAEKDVSELSKTYGRKHPLMIKAEGDLRVLNEKLRQEFLLVIGSVKNEYELALSNENNLRKLLADTKREALNLSEKFIQYGILKREVETNRQVYDSLITKMKEQSLTEELQTVNVWIVEEAETPEGPSKPKKALNIILGIMVGLFGGVGFAFFAEYLDNTVKSPEDAEEKLGVPVLGTVSLLRKASRTDSGQGIEKIVVQEPKSSFAESYKALRTAITLSSAESPPKSILITSSSPGEGKTTTAANLALASAQLYRRVLLVDADMRKPGIHKIFGISNRHGLSTFLAGDASKIIHRNPESNLDIIPAGPVPPNPSELLGARRFKKLVAELAERYDMIVFDSPPALTVTDSLVLSKQVEGTVIVVRAGKTTYELVQNGLKLLKGRRASDLGSNVLGILINALRVTKGDYYYKYYSYYYPSEGEGGGKVEGNEVAGKAVAE